MTAAASKTRPATTDLIHAEGTCDKVTPGTARLAFEIGERTVTLYLDKSVYQGDVPAVGEDGFEIIVRRKAK
jgi:hypothetical protein